MSTPAPGDDGGVTGFTAVGAYNEAVTGDGRQRAHARHHRRPEPGRRAPRRWRAPRSRRSTRPTSCWSASSTTPRPTSSSGSTPPPTPTSTRCSRSCSAAWPPAWPWPGSWPGEGSTDERPPVPAPVGPRRRRRHRPGADRRRLHPDRRAARPARPHHRHHPAPGRATRTRPGLLRGQPDAADAVVRSARPNLDYPAGGATDAIKRRGYLRVGLDTTTALFSIVDPATGEFEGFDVEIAREVAESLGVDMRPIAIPYDEGAGAQRRGPARGQAHRRHGDRHLHDQLRPRRADRLLDPVPQRRAEGAGPDAVGRPVHQRHHGLRAEQTICAPYGSTSIANLSDEAIVGDDGPTVRGRRTTPSASCSCRREGRRPERRRHRARRVQGAGPEPRDHRRAVHPRALRHRHPSRPGRLAGVRQRRARGTPRDNGRWKELYDDILAEPLNEPNAEPPEPKYDS